MSPSPPHEHMIDSNRNLGSLNPDLATVVLTPTMTMSDESQAELVSNNKGTGITPGLECKTPSTRQHLRINKKIAQVRQSW